MTTPLNASASTAGALLSNSIFEVPQFQREYSWERDQVSDFWTDLRSSLDAEAYFLGLVILTDNIGRKYVVDGQQRLITLSLLACALHQEAKSRKREALAERIQATFLKSINYETDGADPRIVLSDEADDRTFQYIMRHGVTPESDLLSTDVSRLMAESYDFLRSKLDKDLAPDPFKRLGRWTDFLTNRLYFAVFVHPDNTSAYQVYEVINTRGKELTTADLLKNYLLSQASVAQRAARYKQWQSLSHQFSSDAASSTFVQFIRHAVTVNSGHILPKDLFGFLARRIEHGDRVAPNAEMLLDILEKHLPVYLQMMDPSAAGPASGVALDVFSALNSLSVIAVRPILLAVADLPDADEAMQYVLRLVVRRIVVGNLGTGNVERRFGEAARRVTEKGDWRVLREELGELNPPKEDFIQQLKRRSFNKSVLTFLRRSAVQRVITPHSDGNLHFIWTNQADAWHEMSQEDGAFWGGTIGNAILLDIEKRPENSLTWRDFRSKMLPSAIPGEFSSEIGQKGFWDAAAVEDVGLVVAESAAETWY